MNSLICTIFDLETLQGVIIYVNRQTDCSGGK